MSLTISLSCEEIEQSGQNTTICQAEGELYIIEDVTVKFSADIAQLTVSSDGNMTSVCEGTKPIMPFVIKEVNIYGLNDTLNNYDHMRHVNASIDLCKLDDGDILFEFYN